MLTLVNKSSHILKPTNDVYIPFVDPGFVFGNANLTAICSLLVTAKKIGNAQALLACTLNAGITGKALRHVAGNLSATTALLANATGQTLASATLSATLSAEAQAVTKVAAIAVLNAIGSLSATPQGTNIVTADATLSAVAGFDAIAIRQALASGNLAAVVSAVASGVIQHTANITGTIILSATANAIALRAVAAVLDSVISATTTATRVRTANAILGATGSFTGTASAGWIPSDVAGLQLWLKASLLTGFADNDPVGTWPDNYSTANDFSNGTGSEQPLYHSNHDGESAVIFDGSNDGLVCSGLSGLSGNSWTMIIRLRITAMPGFGPMFLATTGSNYIQAYSTSTMGVSDGSGTSNLTGVTTWVDSTWKTLTVRCQLGTIEAYINGTLATSVSETRSWAAGSKTVHMGRGSSGNFNQLQGAIGGILLYNSTLNSTDRANAEAYLSS